MRIQDNYVHTNEYHRKDTFVSGELSMSRLRKSGDHHVRAEYKC